MKKLIMRRETAPGCKAISSLSVCLALLLGASMSLAAHHESQKATASDVQEEAMETYDALRSYSLAQRDEAIEVAQEKIKKLDVRISELETAIDEKWQGMSKATQAKTRETLETLRQKRQDLSEWLGGIRYSSEAAWDDVKKGFADSYDRLEKAFVKASENFAHDKEQ